MTPFLLPLLGGVLIGLAVSLMLFLNGRVTGVSGIVSGALEKRAQDFGWRLAFILGLLAGGLFLKLLFPESLSSFLVRSSYLLIVAGLLVGFGTVMGGGCTSGHGICGISRLSKRSIVATLIFMLFGVLSATALRMWLEGASV